MAKTPVAARAATTQRRLMTVIASRRFFWFIVALFSFQSLWIALTARYPMAFDEQFHFGIIRIYSHHLSPFLSHQPAGGDQFGAIVADPSYLYHYLLSFPLRLIQLGTDNQTVQIILLRMLNIGLFASSLFVFRKLFRLAKVSDALSNVLLLCFVLVPVVPLLAAEINYDNLMVPASALSVYLTARFSMLLRAKKVWNWAQLCGLLSVCLLASLVKYAFIPIFAAIIIWLLLDWRWYRRHRAPTSAKLAATKGVSWRLIGYGSLLVVATILFSQRYIVNTVRYHTPVPECNQVLSVSNCLAYGPWARNYFYNQQNIHLPINQVTTYPFVWVYHALNELLFSITSRFSASGSVKYYAAPQMIVIEILAWMVFACAIFAVLVYFRRLAQDRLVQLFALISLLYIAALGGQNYLDYLHLGYPVAIHGRYLLPILPLLLLIVGRAFQFGLQSLSYPKVSLPARKLSVSIFVLAVLLIEGGGFGTYIIRSRDDWAWPQSRAAQQANHAAREVLHPFVVNVGS